MPCSHCNASKVLARGLCQPCYHRLRRSGSVQRVNVPRIGHCRHPGCTKPIDSKGLCQRHYAQADHPAKASWKLLRSRWPGEFPAHWESFQAFVDEVGSRPSPAHQLRRKDRTKPWSRDNVQWLIRVPDPKGPDYTRDASLRLKYGITSKDYERMLKAQGGRCALAPACHSKAGHHLRSGKAARFAVDHDHHTGIVRGLLCLNCNRGLGYLQSNSALLRKAADYLETASARLL